MSAKNQKYFEKVISFIESEWPGIKKEDLNINTDIVNELGIYGDDCDEILEKFCEKFSLDCSELDFSKCGTEIDPITGFFVWIWQKIRRIENNRKIGIKVLELVQLLEESSKNNKK